MLSLLIIACHCQLTRATLQSDLSNIPRISPKQSKLNKEYHFCGNDNFKLNFIVPESRTCCINAACAGRGQSAKFGGGGSKYFGWTLNVGRDGKTIQLHKWGGGWGGGNCKHSNDAEKTLPIITCTHNVVGIVVNEVIYDKPILKSKHNPPKGSTLEFEITKEQIARWSFSESVMESERKSTVTTVMDAVSSSKQWDFNVFKFGNEETETRTTSHELEVLKSRLSHWSGELFQRVEVRERYHLESGSVIVTMKCCRKYPIILEYDGAEERIVFEECIDYTTDRLACDDLWGEEKKHSEL
eukprot:174824_1